MDLFRNIVGLPLQSEIKEASIEDGGKGAFYIFLKKKIKNKF